MTDAQTMLELIGAYDEYVKLLSKSEKGLLGLAMAHGYRCPDELVNRGLELRAKIADLRSRFAVPAPAPDNLDLDGTYHSPAQVSDATREEVKRLHEVGDIIREMGDCGFYSAIELIDRLTKERDAAEAALASLPPAPAQAPDAALKSGAE